MEPKDWKILGLILAGMGFFLFLYGFWLYSITRTIILFNIPITTHPYAGEGMVLAIMGVTLSFAGLIARYAARHAAKTQT